GQLFSIVIPSWNNLPYLKLCIDSIRKHSHFSHQLVVHINEGKDGTLQWVDAQSDIDYTYSEENIGVCYALNAARSLVRTSYFLYINDDMYVCPGWDRALADEIETIGHNLFFLSCTPIEPRLQSNCAIEMDCGRDISSFDEQKLLQNYADLPMHDWQGALSPPNIVHIDTWDLVGGYSIEFSPGLYSDPDFCVKLWHMGVRYFKGLEKSRVYHFGSISLRRARLNRGYYTFVSKWGMTQKLFTASYLRRGQKFDGPLTEPVIGGGKKLKNMFKQLKAVFYREG
ncbi:MAG: glycosyltransferase, partial [Bacteroidetes bacterium]|nr:glycosyltransferase [Bacteroidota bacterium]